MGREDFIEKELEHILIILVLVCHKLGISGEDVKAAKEIYSREVTDGRIKNAKNN